MKKYFSICLVLAIFNFFSYRALASGKKRGKPTDEFTNLLECIKKGNLKQVKKILNKNPSFVNQEDSKKRTPLTVAIQNDRGNFAGVYDYIGSCVVPRRSGAN